jgi:dipeptidyl aminopeptidase/acylaminoacyl peptidase
VAFSSRTAGGIFQKPAAGNGQEELLVQSGVNGRAFDWSPDGKWIVFREEGQKTGGDLWLLPLEGNRKPVAYLQTAFDEYSARFSPDGRWMAYASNESGQDQIYVQTVPASGVKYQISVEGGGAPMWRHDGKELFYVSADQKMMAVPIALGPATVAAGTPQALFPFNLNLALPVRNVPSGVYAPSRDGQRFLVNLPAGGENVGATPVTVVTNWQAGLRK